MQVIAQMQAASPPVAVIGSRVDIPSRLPENSPIFNFIHSVRNGCLEIISVIPDLDDDQLKAVHDHSAELERFGWLVRSYVRYEFLQRAVRLKGGRSLKDVDEVGLVALAKKLAVELHVHHTTILEDARIIARLIRRDAGKEASTPSLNCSDAPTVSEIAAMPEMDLLPEKEFWRIAARSENPIETLNGFAQQRAENPFFNTRDAYRQEKEAKTPPLDEEIPPLIEDAAIKQWYAQFQALRAASPTESIRRIMQGAAEEIRYEVQKPNGTRLHQILTCISRNVDEADTIAADIRQDRIFVITWLNRMADDGLIISFEKERPPNARGAARTGYRLTDGGGIALKTRNKK